MSEIRVAVIGATGYGGSEIVRLLENHPVAKVTTVTSSRNPGKLLREECPWLGSDLVLARFNAESLNVDVVFLAQENGFAMQHVPSLKARVIDLSADYRLKDVAVYEATYGKKHLDGDGLKNAVYGLPELVPVTQIATARIIANPGCYPTATLLGLMPLFNAGLVSGVPVVDAKSGVSGAGRARTETDYMFAEVTGGFRAYTPIGHRHTPEIEQMAGVPIRFTPHLIPAARGIHVTSHVPLNRTVTRAELSDLYRSTYQSRRFVNILEALPTTKQVTGSNRCDIRVDFDERTQMAVICSVIDNLVKGAAGQAIQNMNLMLSLPETTGLPISGVWP